MAKIQEVPIADSGTDSDPLEQVQYDAGYNVFSNKTQHSEQPEFISNTCVVETGDSNVIPDSLDMCDNDNQNDQNAVECDDERVALANLIFHEIWMEVRLLMLVHMIYETLVLDNKDLDVVEQQQQVLMG
nr:hypothetical protein [Tanacetum cinerariifolium]